MIRTDDYYHAGIDEKIVNKQFKHSFIEVSFIVCYTRTEGLFPSRKKLFVVDVRQNSHNGRM